MIRLIIVVALLAGSVSAHGYGVYGAGSESCATWTSRRSTNDPQHFVGLWLGFRRSEKDLSDLFPDCELGAMPPFGNLYGMHVYVGESLTHDEEIAFNAGSHTELIKMTHRDFESLVHPEVVYV